ncbi:MAG: hypothetical protein KC591_03005 [Gemmatimonadetes bacterium]|nr:hypothetical protein [Gemmatimonadota bacterium]
MSRRTGIAIAVSGTAHVALLVALVLWGARDRDFPLRRQIPVRLIAAAEPPLLETPAREAAPTDSPPPVRPPAAETPPAESSRPELASPPPDRPLPPEKTDEEEDLPPPRVAPLPLRAPERSDDVASEWWADRSMVSFIQGARLGDAPRDSILDDWMTPAERILARTDRGLNETFLKLRRKWREEKFREEYQKNFPLMK